MKTLLLTMICCLCFVGMVVCTQGIGALLPTRTEALTLVQEVQLTPSGWCWRGLCLGTDRMDKAEQQLTQNVAFNDLIGMNGVPDSLLQWHWKDNEHRRGSFNQVPNTGNLSLLIFSMQFDQLALGNVVRLFGTPHELYVQESGVGTDLAFQICFEHDICAWVLQHDDLLRHYSIIHDIDFMHRAPNQPIEALAPVHWRGFTRYPLN